MNVYIAAPWECRHDAARYARVFRIAGYAVTSEWWRSTETSDAQARADLAAIDAADLVVVLNPPQYAAHGTGGRHVELGYAIAKGKRILVLGDRSNLFHWLADLEIDPEFYTLTR